MSDADALRELAARCGVVPGYHDIWGRWHEPGEAALRAVLLELGALEAPDEDAAAALARHDAREWAHPLPPVVVSRCGDSGGEPPDEAGARPAIRLALPAGLSARPLGWRIALEDGGELAGTVVLEAGGPQELREIDGSAIGVFGWRLPAALPAGYHRLELRAGGEALASATVIAAPHGCYRPDSLRGDARLWGPSVQLYALRSARNWGIGDFTDLRTLLEQWAAQGADLVGLNPLHALFPANPAHARPYSPSSRRFLNTAYIDVEAVPGFARCEAARRAVAGPAFQARLAALRAEGHVDYPGVAAAKAEILSLLWAHFRGEGQGQGQRQSQTQSQGEGGDGHDAGLAAARERFARFRQLHGAALRAHATFEALHECFAAGNGWAAGWAQWPEPFRDCGSPEVAAWARDNAGRIDYFEWLQWLAWEQLEAVGRRSSELGLALGLYMDLAVSVDRHGADTWAWRGLFAAGASVGAPPDDFNLNGQDWGLPPMLPDRLRELGWEPFAQALRANMRAAGALRIDHVMGLMRLYWVPAGWSAAEGLYLRYPFDEALAVVALESHRNRCAVIGEDLGTVPDEVRAAMRERGMIGCRPLIFEKRHDGEFRGPGEIEPEAAVSVTTHDLPTLAGWWLGRDIEVRERLGLFAADSVRDAQRAARESDRAALLRALEREGLLPVGTAADPAALPELGPDLARAVHACAARSPSRILAVQPEDLLGMTEQVNLPGSTSDIYPNWSRKLAVELERWPALPAFAGVAAAIRAERGKGDSTK